jgi:hypothetical protein
MDRQSHFQHQSASIIADHRLYKKGCNAVQRSSAGVSATMIDPGHVIDVVGSTVHRRPTDRCIRLTGLVFFRTKSVKKCAEHFQSKEFYAVLALSPFTYYKQWVVCTPVIFSFSRDD